MNKYILNGKTPVIENDLMRWAHWFEKADRTVKVTRLPGDVKVSTVFLGMDHGFLNDKPMLFETMIFGGEHDEYQERYATWEEAENGHDEAVQLVFS